MKHEMKKMSKSFNLNERTNGVLSITCDKEILKKDEDTVCTLKISDLNYVVTSINGSITVSDNLKIINSIYDDNEWKIFDKKFIVSDINLISEEKKLREQITIANFTVRAIKNVESVEKISANQFYLGDGEYKEHVVMGTQQNIKLQKSSNLFYLTFVIILLISIILILKRRVNK